MLRYLNKFKNKGVSNSRCMTSQICMYLLQRLASAPIPFTVLTIAGNPANEDYLAVCGLKDCHVLTFSSSGTVTDHLVLHPSLETGNFIIKVGPVSLLYKADLSLL